MKTFAKSIDEMYKYYLNLLLKSDNIVTFQCSPNYAEYPMKRSRRIYLQKNISDSVKIFVYLESIFDFLTSPNLNNSTKFLIFFT